MLAGADLQGNNEVLSIHSWLRSDGLSDRHAPIPPAVQGSLAQLAADHGSEDSLWDQLFQAAPAEAIVALVRVLTHQCPQ